MLAFIVIFLLGVSAIIAIWWIYPMTPGALIWSIYEPLQVLEHGSFFGKDHYVSTVPNYIRMGGRVFRMSHLDNNWGRLDVIWIADNYDAHEWYKYRKPLCEYCDLDMARSIRMEEEQKRQDKQMLQVIEHAKELGVTTWGSSAYDSQAYYKALSEESETYYEELEKEKEELPAAVPYASEEEEE